MSGAAGAFAIAFAVTLAVALIQGPKPFYGDSGSYWSLAATFTRHGHFSLLNFQSPVRGYAMALITGVLQAAARGLRWSDSTIVKLFNALLFALIGAVLAPQVAVATWRCQRWLLGRRLAVVMLLVIFWSGDLNYPLSDFPGLALALLAILAMARADRPGWMLIGGVAVGLAIDIRPAYLLLAPMSVAVVVWRWIRAGVSRRQRRHLVLCLALFAVAFATVSLPQSLSSHRHYHTWNFIPGAPENLTAEQLTDGVPAQRYDTFVEHGRAYGMVYPDGAGQRLLQQQPGERIASPTQYAGVVVAHPLVMAGLTLRHILNGLDMRYSTVYVEHLDHGGHLWLRLMGFLLVFLALVRLLWPAARRSLGPTSWRLPAALLLCCLTSVLARIETRYMLPVWLLCYILVLAPGWPNPLAVGSSGMRRLRTPALLAVAYLAFMAAVWGLLNGVSAHVVR
jgi:hypothetical protein